MVKKPIVIWDKVAEAALQSAYKRIKEDSPKNAEKVRDEIFAATRKLADHPEMHPPDKFKKHNPENYRVFELHAYRVAYLHTAEEIRILRVRHVRQEPKDY